MTTGLQAETTKARSCPGAFQPAEAVSIKRGRRVGRCKACAGAVRVSDRGYPRPHIARGTRQP